jgi:hypothetical protein
MWELKMWGFVLIGFLSNNLDNELRLLFPLEQFCFGFGLGKHIFVDSFRPESEAPACSKPETVPSLICFRYSLLLCDLSPGIFFKGHFPLLFWGFSLCFIPSDGKPGIEPLFALLSAVVWS